MKEYLTYDDVQILPKYSEVKHRVNCDTSTYVTKNWELKIPIVSSPMDTVTEVTMAQHMNELGGLGIIHRFLSIEEQSSQTHLIIKVEESTFSLIDFSVLLRCLHDF